MDPHSGSTQAVALTYTEGAAPILSAKAEAALAQEMIALAEDAGVFIHKDPQLCDFYSNWQWAIQSQRHCIY